VRDGQRLATRWAPTRDSPRFRFDSPYDSDMTTKTATEARANLYRLLDQVAKTHEPIAITGRRHNGVLIAEEDWRAIEETLYLLSIPGMRESIRKGLRTPLSKTSEKPGW
jgi:antitoxin YefM